MEKEEKYLFLRKYKPNKLKFLISNQKRNKLKK